MGKTTYSSIQLEGDPAEPALQMASRVVLPVAHEVLHHEGTSGVLQFYTGLIVMLQLHAAMALGKAVSVQINASALQQVQDLDTTALEAAQAAAQAAAATPGTGSTGVH
jgi:hypothetical protein